MPQYTTSTRLKQIMNLRNLKQIDIVRMAEPYCKKYKVKMGRNAVSQYVSGKVVPRQNALFILGQALNVSDAWLMGFDVPMERQTIDRSSPDTVSKNNTDDERQLICIPKSSHVTDLERAIIEAYFELPFEIRETVINHFVSRLSS